jgi:hypothetical protein
MMERKESDYDLKIVSPVVEILQFRTDHGE